MGAIASQITILNIVYSTVYSDADQRRKHQSSASLAFVDFKAPEELRNPLSKTVLSKCSFIWRTCQHLKLRVKLKRNLHYNDVIMGAIASQITILNIVYSTVYSDADQRRKHQSSASLAFVDFKAPEELRNPLSKTVLSKCSFIWRTCQHLKLRVKLKRNLHYNDVIMGAIASQITILNIVYSTVYSDADQRRKHQSSASLAFVDFKAPEELRNPLSKTVLSKCSFIWRTCQHLKLRVKLKRNLHYNDVIMGAIASQITILNIVYSTVYSDADQRRKHQSSASQAFVRGIHRSPVNSPHKGPVTRKMFPFDDVIMCTSDL